jgi:hypothetical protein
MNQLKEGGGFPKVGTAAWNAVMDAIYGPSPFMDGVNPHWTTNEYAEQYALDLQQPREDDASGKDSEPAGADPVNIQESRDAIVTLIKMTRTKKLLWQQSIESHKFRASIEPYLIWFDVDTCILTICRGDAYMRWDWQSQIEPHELWRSQVDRHELKQAIFDAALDIQPFLDAVREAAKGQ